MYWTSKQVLCNYVGRRRCCAECTAGPSTEPGSLCSWLLIKVVAVARCCVKCVSVVLMEQRHGCVSERLVKKKNKQVCFQSGYYSKSWALLFYVLTKTATKCWVKSPLVNQMNFPKFFSYSRRSYFITKELLFFFFSFFPLFWKPQSFWRQSVVATFSPPASQSAPPSKLLSKVLRMK